MTKPMDQNVRGALSVVRPGETTVAELLTPALDRSQAPTTSNALKKALSEVGFSERDVVVSLVELATTGRKTTVVRDGNGKVQQEVIVDDPNVKLKALEKIIDLMHGQPRRQRIGYIEETEW